MKYAKYIVLAFVAMVLLFIGSNAAEAGPVRVGNFQVCLNDDVVTSVPSENTGYENGTWFLYDNPNGIYLPNPTFATNLPAASPPPPQMWWNEWWYNDPMVMPGGKWVRIEFDYQLVDPMAPGSFFVTINWSTPEWSTDIDGNIIDTVNPPVPGMVDNPELYLVRLEPWFFVMDPGDTTTGHFDSEVFWLPIDYNPEWVSVDVQGQNVFIFNGIIEHQCAPVPIPGAVVLLGSGLVGLAGIKRKIKK